MKLIQSDDGRTFSDMETDESNPCLNCGACCAHFRISFYCGESNALGGTVPDWMIEKLSDTMGCMSGTEAGSGRCVALAGKIGDSIACTIYENRPTPCREYHVWDEQGMPNPKCQELRAKRGIPLLERQHETSI